MLPSLSSTGSSHLYGCTSSASITPTLSKLGNQVLSAFHLNIFYSCHKSALNVCFSLQDFQLLISLKNPNSSIYAVVVKRCTVNIARTLRHYSKFKMVSALINWKYAKYRSSWSFEPDMGFISDK